MAIRTGTDGQGMAVAGLVLLAGLLLLPLLGGRRRSLVLAGMLILGGLLLLGCGGGNQRTGSGPQPTQGTLVGQYARTVTAIASNGVSRSTQLTRNVQ